MLSIMSSISLILILPMSAALRVCTNTVCRKAGSQDTLDMLTALAACAAPTAPGAVAADCQRAFAAESVQSCGCLGGCGRGPNCVGEDDEIYYDVYKPKSGVALLLEELKIDVPDEATRAWLHRMYAMRAMRSNQPREAVSLFTSALNEAGALGVRGALLLSQLLDKRADAHELVGDGEKAAADRAQAESMLGLTYPAPVASAQP